MTEPFKSGLSRHQLVLFFLEFCKSSFVGHFLTPGSATENNRELKYQTFLVPRTPT